VVQRGDRRGEAREADDGVQHDVGIRVRRELGERVGVVAARACELARHAELGPLRVEELGVAARRERDDLVAVAMVAHDFQGLGADRSRRPEDDDLANAVGVRAGHQRRPRARTR
jgi:hypothetical protein